MRAWLAIVTAVTLSAVAHRAAAETKAIDYTYEVENVDSYPENVFVAWPRACGSTGDPLGAVSLALNPDWASRQHDVDYEVLVSGAHHALLSYCLRTTSIFALPAAQFARAERVATGDDSALGKRRGETYAVLPVLDDIELPKRISFFASDPRRTPSSFRFDPLVRASATSPLKAVHDVLAVRGGLEAAAFLIETVRVVYTYEDGISETVPYRGPRRPLPSRAGALDLDAGGAASAAAGVDGVDASADGIPVESAGAPPDRGTRWVYAAAVLGLVVGGGYAQFAKRRSRRSSANDPPK